MVAVGPNDGTLFSTPWYGDQSRLQCGGYQDTDPRIFPPTSVIPPRSTDIRQMFELSECFLAGL